ncbi:NIF3-like protein 1 [Cylas formicarius]|uniref:NIF3-like protein 1 n=1 Tax=Cylas formicarius TaxID=197179 RepID=UPI0029586B17|nr:NIF3-like protein 1 [Cylas formicarius]
MRQVMNIFLNIGRNPLHFLRSPVDIYVSIAKKKSVHTNHCLYQIPQKMGISLQDLVKRLQCLAPLNLAESWDNVGLLVEPHSDKTIDSVLLTIDLTEDVVNEAINVGAQLIISYHPNIFKPLKSVTQSAWKERIIIQCIKNGIAIFSPHTTWDAMENGVNDWLASVFEPATTKPILPNTENSNVGMGRYVTLNPGSSLKKLIKDIKTKIGVSFLRIGLGKGKNFDDTIQTVAVCAGSGASVLNGVKADLYLTGEMLHHDVLDATQNGISVILCNHSDSERGFLKTVKNILSDQVLTVSVSSVDKDCLTTV